MEADASSPKYLAPTTFSYGRRVRRRCRGIVMPPLQTVSNLLEPLALGILLASMCVRTWCLYPMVYRLFPVYLVSIACSSTSTTPDSPKETPSRSSSMCVSPHSPHPWYSLSRIQGCSAHVSRGSTGFPGSALMSIAGGRAIDCLHVVLSGIIYYHYTVDCFGDSKALESVYW